MNEINYFMTKVNPMKTFKTFLVTLKIIGFHKKDSTIRHIVISDDL